MSEVNERTQRTSLLRGPVTDIPGLTTYLAATYLPLAGGTISGELFIASGGGLYLYDPSAEADVQISVDDGYLLVGGVTLLDNNSTLDASKLGVGTVPDARLSSNVPLKNAANTFTAAQSIQGIITSDNASGGLHIVNSAMRVVKNGATLLIENQSTGWPLDLSHPLNGFTNVVGAQGGLPTLGFSLTRSNNNPDVRVVRNATGPTLETRAAGGLKVSNADGSAVAGVQCSTVTASGFIDASSIRCDGSQVFDTITHLSRTALDVGRAGGFNVVALGGVFGNPQTLIPIGGLTSSFPALRRNNAEIDLRLADDSAFTSLNLLHLTASGNVQGTFRPTPFTVATLPSAAANTGRTVQVTDSSVDFPGNIGNTVAGGGAFNVDVKSNGTNWRITG